MLQIRSFFTYVLSLLFLALPVSAHSQSASSNRTPVLVELFTSEGCSSCPPADALLARLDQDQPIQNAEIIVLGEHVDYWDNLGWHDRFSSHQYTERQSQYSARLGVDGVYTPQMIVDGTDQFVGNDSTHARRSITSAAQKAKLNLSLSRPVVDARKISASVSLPASSSSSHGELYAALVDPTDVTDVRNGENGGRRLLHVGVVRNLQRIGSLKDLGAGPLNFSLNAPGDANLVNIRVVVFAQQNNQGNVLGAVVTDVKR
ncbi:DUF1223 domain-containing protein [Tunturibacter empetritectus]|uniref:DUF1223 domain-containing protein n=1 Tax=Tunturiibacter lichenicola TaxID=2051959 RepID=A0A7W8JDK1_9BACT|nr:DUF1223 domain-containing protein [Edaphobacter lichenicola]MBB5346056.1 hypothetical protein [Edaphobacter lichenicola]